MTNVQKNESRFRKNECPEKNRRVVQGKMSVVKGKNKSCDWKMSVVKRKNKSCEGKRSVETGKIKAAEGKHKRCGGKIIPPAHHTRPNVAGLLRPLPTHQQLTSYSY